LPRRIEVQPDGLNVRANSRPRYRSANPRVEMAGSGSWRFKVLCVPSGEKTPASDRDTKSSQHPFSARIMKLSLTKALARKGSHLMAKNIYVGNLAWAVTNDDLLELFGQYGKVTNAQVIMDRDTGRSRGFGFVEMENDEEAQKAIEALDGATHENRPLTVNVAKEREDRGGRGGGGGGYGGGGGGRRGGGNFGGSDRGRRY
jgi:uncharacterized membrane protein YgcG